MECMHTKAVKGNLTELETVGRMWSYADLHVHLAVQLQLIQSSDPRKLFWHGIALR